ncbi:MAG TPA: hypothetical protein VFR21_24445 [Bradyrhizobium sp.]|nr:hypothetical protein [Bradyrhizobium sp.]
MTSTIRPVGQIGFGWTRPSVVSVQRKPTQTDQRQSVDFANAINVSQAIRRMAQNNHLAVFPKL